MRFTTTDVPPATVVDLEKREDERGWFARAFCADEYAEVGLTPVTAQTNMSLSRTRGTIRGLHFQTAPHEEAKLVRCLRGAILDVAVDVRPGSETYLQHVAVELTEHDHRALHVPEGFAHGFQALTDDVLLVYQVSASYTPGAEQGLRFDDPALGIAWPLPVTDISDKDAAWPLLSERQPDRGAVGT
ncbi:MAG: dTDP-4-dehydrorhamnose 3,5-epimerase [Actinobacteria bacterium]|nr:dTDP-4-dehydrorhamnose 3,5-epimerase [Actinomycetota bacterium]